MSNQANTYPYPRRRVIRWLMSRAARVALCLLSHFRIEGRHHLPAGGPLIIVANHFHFLDVVTMVAAMPWPMEFLGGFRFFDAPGLVGWIPRLWGFYTVHRGGASMEAMRAAKAVLAQNGTLMVFPEGGSWADVLVYARPGVPYLLAQTGARVLPVGIDGNTELFPSLRRGRRGRITVRIGEPFGPISAPGRGRERRQQLDAIGDQIMQRIAPLIPPERRGVYSADPALRAAAEAVAAYPWAEEEEA